MGVGSTKLLVWNLPLTNGIDRVLALMVITGGTKEWSFFWTLSMKIAREQQELFI